jgi:hypothetical protein
MPVDPSMMAPPPGQITMSVPEFIQIIAALKGGGGGGEPKAEGGGDGAAAPAKPKKPSKEEAIHQKLDAIMQQVGGQAPAAPAPTGG